MSGGVRIALAQDRKLTALAQFASDLDEATHKPLERGQGVTELMQQNQYTPLPISLQAQSIYASNEGYLDDVPVNKLGAFEEGLHAHFANTNADLLEKINSTGAWNDEIEAAFKAGIEDYKKTGTW